MLSAASGQSSTTKIRGLCAIIHRAFRVEGKVASVIIDPEVRLIHAESISFAKDENRFDRKDDKTVSGFSKERWEVSLSSVLRSHAIRPPLIASAGRVETSGKNRLRCRQNAISAKGDRHTKAEPALGAGGTGRPRGRDHQHNRPSIAAMALQAIVAAILTP
jgi:hypothetical protein